MLRLLRCHLCAGCVARNKRCPARRNKAIFAQQLCPTHAIQLKFNYKYSIYSPVPSRAGQISVTAFRTGVDSPKNAKKGTINRAVVAMSVSQAIASRSESDMNGDNAYALAATSKHEDASDRFRLLFDSLSNSNNRINRSGDGVDEVKHDDSAEDDNSEYREAPSDSQRANHLAVKERIARSVPTSKLMDNGENHTSQDANTILQSHEYFIDHDSNLLRYDDGGELFSTNNTANNGNNANNTDESRLCDDGNCNRIDTSDNITCVGDPMYCNYTYDEYVQMLRDYIAPTVPEWILIFSHAIVFFMGLVSFPPLGLSFFLFLSLAALPIPAISQIK